MKSFLALALALAAFATGAVASTPVPIVFDTDMGNDVDDALALAMLHALESRGECRIVAVTLTKDNPWSAVFVDLANTFYGRAYIPVGVVKGSGVTPENSPMIQVPSERKRADGSFVYPRRLASGAEAPDAVAVLRRALAAERDGSVVIVQVGFSTNLARLLASGPDSASPLGGRELAARKVRFISLMAGNFAQKSPEYNVKMDIPSAQALYRDWPTPVVVSGFEVGDAIRFPATSIQNDFAYVPDHPIAEAYRTYQKMPYDRQTWDLTAALYAVRPDRGYFSLSPAGTISVDAKGNTDFTPSPEGKHRYLTVNDAQRARALEAMIYLASQPPEAHPTR